MINDHPTENFERAAGVWWWLNRRSDIQLLIALMLLVFGLYYNSLGNRFVYDDHVLIEANNSLREWSYFTTAFTDSHSYDVAWLNLKNSSIDYYRPFTRMLFALAFQAFGLKTFYWHLLNVTIFAGVVALGYSIVKQLTNQRALAFLATLLFAVHPIHSEAVAWINCLVETLHALFFLGAFSLYLKSRSEDLKPRSEDSSGDGRIFFIGSLAMAAGGLLSKETSLAFPIVIGAYNFIFTDDKFLKRILAGIRASIPFLLVCVGYFILRYFAYGGSLRMASHVPFSTVIATIPRVILEYFSFLLFPLKLSVVHNVPYVTSFISLRFWLPVLLIIALAAAIWLYTSREFVFASVWMMITMLPILNIGIFSPSLLLQDRYVFLPSLGFCMLIAMALAKVFQNDGFWLRLWPVAALATLVVVVALSALTVRQNRFWYSDRTLFGRAAAMNPNSEFAHCNYGFALYNEDDRELAARQYSDAIQVTKRETGLESSCGCLGLGNYYSEKKDFSQAVIFLEQALNLGEGEFNLLIFNHLAYAYDQLGQSQKAQDLLRDVLTKHPDFQEAHLTLSQILLRDGKFSEGLVELNQSIELNPQDATARLLLGEIYENRGQRKEAIEQYRIVLSISPDNELARTHLSALEQGSEK